MKMFLSFSMVLSALPVWAEPSAKSGPGGLTMLVPWIAILGIFYFLLIRPQQKERQKHQDMVNSLKRGDHVLTQGGLYGVVQSVKGKTVEVKIAENVKVQVERSYIARVLQGDPTVVEPEVVANGVSRS